MRYDVVVLGAGMVGISIACHLAARGRSVALVDRRGPGEETSFGNSGVVEGSLVLPHPFPRDIGTLVRAALGRAPEANWHLAALPGLLPWLAGYWSASRQDRLEDSGRALRALAAIAVTEHKALVAEAGAWRLWREDGWIRLYRSKAGLDATRRMRDLADAAGISHSVLGPDEALALEPHLAPHFAGAIHMRSSSTVSSPGDLVKAYATVAARRGVTIVVGDARTLRRTEGRWRVTTAAGDVEANETVMALGPWASDLFGSLGLDLPLAVKRGYHRHYGTQGNATLTRPVVDAEKGYVLCPMDRGIRITTGSEFTTRDAPATPVQLGQVEPLAREMFPALGNTIDGQPWLGARPAFPDSLPVIGPAPKVPGVWLAFGHTHWGFTLGPVTGRLLAEMMTGETPFTDPAPYAATRFAKS